MNTAIDDVKPDGQDSALAAAAADTPNTPAAHEPPPDAVNVEPVKTPEEIAAEQAAQVEKDKADKLERQNQAWERIRQQKSEYKAKAEYLEKMLFDKQKAEAVSQEPQREQFNSDIEYYQAARAYDNRQFDIKLQREREQMAQQANVNTFISKTAEAKKELPDFDMVMAGASDVKYVPEVQEAIVTSPYAGFIAYELAKDTELAEQIAAMTPAQASRTIGKIEARIESRKQPARAPAAVSKAPQPLKPVGAQGGEEVNIDWSKKSDAEYFAHLRKKGAMPA